MSAFAVFRDRQSAAGVEMTFTDADLKRLKELIRKHESSTFHSDSRFDLCSIDFAALFARLEDAEADRDRYKNLLEMAELTRKAAGK